MSDGSEFRLLKCFISGTCASGFYGVYVARVYVTEFIEFVV